MLKLSKQTIDDIQDLGGKVKHKHSLKCEIKTSDRPHKEKYFLITMSEDNGKKLIEMPTSVEYMEELVSHLNRLIERIKNG